VLDSGAREGNKQPFVFGEGVSPWTGNSDEEESCKKTCEVWR